MLKKVVFITSLSFLGMFLAAGIASAECTHFYEGTFGCAISETQCVVHQCSEKKTGYGGEKDVCGNAVVVSDCTAEGGLTEDDLSKFMSEKYGCAENDTAEQCEAKVNQQQSQGKPEGVEILKSSAATKLNPMQISNPQDLFSRSINLMLAFMGSIALVLYIYAGFMWMTAGGNDEKVSTAKRIFVWTTLGAIAMGASYMIVRTVLERLG